MAYWDLRFNREGKIWGDKSSTTVSFTIKAFREHNIQKILVVGSGYGRNVEVLAHSGFDVFGLELSTTANKMTIRSSKEKGLSG